MTGFFFSRSKWTRVENLDNEGLMLPKHICIKNEDENLSRTTQFPITI